MKPFNVKRVRLSRRTVLRGIGAGIALPLLDAMLDDRGFVFGESRAHAAPLAPPVRLLTFFFPCGWGNIDPIGNFDAVVAGPLAPFQSDIVVLKNLDKRAQYIDDTSGRGDAHIVGHSTFATGYGSVRGGAGGPSVDQAAAQALGGTTRYRSLPIGIGHPTEPGFAHVSWQGAASPVPAEHDPLKFFQRLFGALTPGARPLDDRKNILDFARADVARLQQRIGRADRARLDQHLTAIAELQQALTATQVNCQVPAAPAADLAPLSNERAQAMMRLLVLALQCDLTRYGSVFLCGRADSRQFPWLAFVGAGGAENEIGHHGYSHDPSVAGEARMRAIVLDQSKQFAFLLKLLKEAPEGAGTLLDNSVVFFTSEHTRSFGHTPDEMPAVVAGRAGGKLVTGRTLDTAGATYARTFVSMLNYAGVPTSSFGPHAPGPLAGL